jgi:hypothetical protein
VVLLAIQCKQLASDVDACCLDVSQRKLEKDAVSSVSQVLDELISTPKPKRCNPS